jgi:hypothetical protein
MSVFVRFSGIWFPMVGGPIAKPKKQNLVSEVQCGVFFERKSRVSHIFIDIDLMCFILCERYAQKDNVHVFVI